MKFFFEKCTTFLFIHILNTLPLANKFHNLPRRCPAQVLFVSKMFSNFVASSNLFRSADIQHGKCKHILIK